MGWSMDELLSLPVDVYDVLVTWVAEIMKPKE
jgi:hypothetical protein